MEGENGWKRLDLHLLARPARAGLADLHGLELRDVCERVLNGVYRIGLREEFRDKSPGHPYGWKGEKGDTDQNAEFE
jgi:hypothetical protein